jgi:hypothetical protein
MAIVAFWHVEALGAVFARTGRAKVDHSAAILAVVACFCYFILKKSENNKRFLG